MQRATWNTTHSLLCGFVLGVTIATALGLRSWVLAVAAILPLVALFFEVRLPAKAVVGGTWVGRAATVGTALGSLTMALFPGVPDGTIFGVTDILGRLLVVLAGTLLLARASPEGSILPAALGAVIAAFLPPEPAWIRAAAGLGAVCLIAWLAIRDDERGGRVVPRPLPLAVFLVFTVSIAAGIAALLPWAQPQVELLVAKAAFNDFEASTGVATASKLGDVEKLSRSKRVALRFYGDVATDLRVRVFTTFDGKAWKADPRPARPLSPVVVPSGTWPALDETPGTPLGERDPSSAPALKAARVIVRSAESGVMPVPAHTIAVKVEDVAIDRSPSGFLLPRSRASLYSVLFAAEEPLDETPGPEMLAVPDKLDPRIRELATTLTSGADSADARADRVSAHFQTGYRYSLDVGSFQTPDPLAEFLFDKKKGYCEYFASATVLLLRLSGVPARYVTGYAVRAFQWSDGHYVVRDSDAHAWAEAYIPGRGWVEVDATPAADYQALHADVESGLLARLGAAYDEVVAFVNQGGAKGFARAVAAHPLALATVLGALVFSQRKRFRRRRAASSAGHAATPVEKALRPEMATLLAQVDAVCAARARPRPPSRAPMEHVVDPDLPLADAERSDCRRAVELVYEGVYGGRDAPAAELAIVIARLSTLRKNSGSSVPRRREG
jgi:transglutaminase-like putative cysteine protease